MFALLLFRGIMSVYNLEHVMGCHADFLFVENIF